MKRFLLVSIGILFIQLLFAQIPNGYYDSATGTGYTLKTQLYNIIKSGHVAQDYGDLYDAYVNGDTDPEDGYVWDMYSENPGGNDPYNYEHYVNNCGTYSNEGDCLNREHLFPQGIFSEALPMKTDYHHVVPSDGKVNGMRNNYPFGEVGSASWTSLNGSKLGTCNYSGYSGTVFEPIDEFKGDIARCMLYFATRYEDKVASWSHEMINGTSDQVYEDWFLSLLIEWHNQDPVSSKETTRNEAGYTFQGNRNPFIDHPEYVAQIWGGDGVFISSVNYSPTSPTSSDDVSVTATITSSGGTVTTANLKWGTSTGIYPNEINMTVASADSYISDSNIPAQTSGTIVYFVIEAIDNEAGLVISTEYSYIVEDPVNQAPVISDVVVNPFNPTESDNVSVSASAIDSDGNVKAVILKWKRGTGAYTEVSMNLSGEKYYGLIPKQTTGETIYFSIIAEDNEGLQGSYDSSYEISESIGIEILTKNNVNVYPNPASQYLFIEFNDFSGMVNIKVFDLIGVVVLNKQIEFTNQYNLNISNLDSGIYFINFENDNVLITKRIIIKK